MRKYTVPAGSTVLLEWPFDPDGLCFSIPFVTQRLVSYTHKEIQMESSGPGNKTEFRFRLPPNDKGAGFIRVEGRLVRIQY